MASTLQTLSKHFLNPALEKALEGRHELIHVTNTKGETESWGESCGHRLLVSKTYSPSKLLVAPLEVQADIHVSVERGYIFSQELYFLKNWFFFLCLSETDEEWLFSIQQKSKSTSEQVIPP